MAQLGICGGCKGLVPDGAQRCPHCERHVPPVALRWARTALAAAGSGFAAMTLMACYGAPCAAGVCGGGTTGFGGGTGENHLDGGEQNFQYCGLPDAGAAPCYPDAGFIDFDAGGEDGGSSDGG